MPHLDHIALVSLTDDVPIRDVLQVAAAVQKQVSRDFAPIWGIEATVDAFADLDSVPSDYRPVVVFGDTRELAGRIENAITPQEATLLLAEFDRGQISGIHLNSFTRQPFALVAADEGWEIAVSHEVLELIADPHGNRLIAVTHPLDHRRRVLVLVEVCDPCQAFWYPVNGIRMSDFYTPRYFDPVSSASTRYSFTGQIERPLQILDGGYITWIDPLDACMYQLQAGVPEPVLLKSVLELQASTVPLRTLVDGDSRTPRVFGTYPANGTVAAEGVRGGVHDAAYATAIRTREAVISLATHRG